MRVRIRALLASSRIGKAMLLGAVMIAPVIPGSDVALSQSPMESSLFTAIALHPDGSDSSTARGISGGLQVGEGVRHAAAGSVPNLRPSSFDVRLASTTCGVSQYWRYFHALLWRGGTDDVVSLHPDGFDVSVALGASGGEQVGFGIPAKGGTRALLWRGSAASVVNLHPDGFDGSAALGTSGGQQVGAGATKGQTHALLWRGSAASVVDINPRGFIYSVATSTFGGRQVGYGVGQDRGSGAHALLWEWRRNVGNVVDLNPSGYYSMAFGISREEQVGFGNGAATGGRFHALLWRGSADSVVDLTPSTLVNSMACGVSAGQQVGWVAAPPDYRTHAMLWRGSADGAVDLHEFLPPGFTDSEAWGIDSTGDIVGGAYAGNTWAAPYHAFLWRRNANVKPAPGRPTDNVTTLRVPNAPKALGVYTNGPVELILTDPQGRRTGYDPVQNTSFHDIPASNYSKTLYRNQQSDQNSSTPEPPSLKALEMANQMPGEYTLEVVGTGSGDFTVFVRASDAAGNRITQSYTGTTAPGISSRFTFRGEVNAFAAFGATLGINPVTGTFEVNATFTLGPGGTFSPEGQPVTVELGAFLATIPAGSFRPTGQGLFDFEGTIKGVALEANLAPTGDNGYAFKIKGANATGLPNDNPVRIGFAIGNNGGSVDVNAEFVR